MPDLVKGFLFWSFQICCSPSCQSLKWINLLVEATSSNLEREKRVSKKLVQQYGSPLCWVPDMRFCILQFTNDLKKYTDVKSKGRWQPKAFERNCKSGTLWWAHWPGQLQHWLPLVAFHTNVRRRLQSCWTKSAKALSWGCFYKCCW